MNSIERTNAALDLKEYDHVSPQPQIDVAYAAKLMGVPVGKAFIDEKIHADALNNVFEVHDVDGVYVNLCLSSADIVSQEFRDGAYYVKDVCGATWTVNEDDIGSATERDITSLDDERLFNMSPAIFAAVDVYKGIDQKWRDEKAIVVGVTGAFSHVVFLYGLENTMMAMVLEPEKLKEVIDARLRFALENIDKLADAGCKYLWIGEGSASGSLISPDMYREFVLPYQQKMAEHIRKRGMRSVVHICGDINKAIESVVTCGTDGIDLDHMNDLATVRDIAKDKMCVKGNFDPVDLQEWSPDKIIEVAKEKIALFPNNKGLILSTGCLVTRDTPKENIDAFVKACL
ncbi:hypothetical protein EZV73_08040 [Acidaminobacter sp. JC074]|uniref:uroporphyrinogen decarboxylase family protein n=1 Tax=Acidaminobacter sp. JC074 TaxID=2530199 RepID=UPI001F0E73D7|nr:uroporphyrinogen decarboxylase family protein [Acidaminobacter sp. JC074]MCH4887518.1 hypothetical protein [Acidaminobacter sp. JC074]